MSLRTWLLHFPCAAQACGIVLRVVKTRQPLLQAAKLLYRLSKDADNDAAFRKEALLEPMLRTVRSGSSSKQQHLQHLQHLQQCLLPSIIYRRYVPAWRTRGR